MTATADFVQTCRMAFNRLANHASEKLQLQTKLSPMLLHAAETCQATDAQNENKQSQHEIIFSEI